MPRRKLEQEEQLEQSPATKMETPEDPSVAAVLALLQDDLVRDFIAKYRLDEKNAEGKYGILTNENNNRMEFCVELAELMLRYVAEVNTPNKADSADPKLHKTKTIEQIEQLAKALMTFGETVLVNKNPLNWLKPLKPCKALLEQKYIYLPKTEAFALLIEQVINPAIQFLDQALAGNDGWFSGAASTAISLVLKNVGFAGIKSFNDLFNPINNYYLSTFPLIKQINQHEIKFNELQNHKEMLTSNPASLEQFEILKRDIETFQNSLISQESFANRLKLLKKEEHRFAQEAVIDKEEHLIHNYAELVTNTGRLLEETNEEIDQEKSLLEEEEEKQEEKQNAQKETAEKEKGKEETTVTAEDDDDDFHDCLTDDEAAAATPHRRSMARKSLGAKDQGKRIETLEQQLGEMQSQIQESQELLVRERQERQEQARQAQTLKKTKMERYIEQRNDFKTTHKLLFLTVHTDELIKTLKDFIETLDLIGLAQLAKDIGFPMNKEDHKNSTVKGEDPWLAKLRLNKGFYKYAKSWFGQNPTYGATNRSKKIGDIIKQCAKATVEQKGKDNLDDEEKVARREIATFNRKREFRVKTSSVKALNKELGQQEANGTNDERGRSLSRSSESEPSSSSPSPN